MLIPSTCRGAGEASAASSSAVRVVHEASWMPWATCTVMQGYELGLQLRRVYAGLLACVAIITITLQHATTPHPATASYKLAGTADAVKLSRSLTAPLKCHSLVRGCRKSLSLSACVLCLLPSHAQLIQTIN